MQDETNATTIEDSVGEIPAEQAEVQEETQGQEAQVEEVAEETQDAETTNEPSQVTESEQSAPIEEIDWSQYVPDVTAAPPVDETGNIDPVKWQQQMKAEARFEAQEVRSWTRLETEHPELRTDAGLREMILAKRMFDVQRGNQGTLDAAAKEVFTRLGGAKNEGKAAAQTNITVQKSAALQKPSGAKASTAVGDDVRNRIRQGDQGATHAALMDWISSGKI